MPKDSDEPIDFATAYQLLTGTLTAAGSGLFNAGAGFARSRQFFELLGNPQESYKSIHIAGTSGKGTVAYMLQALLKAHGFHTGLHASPHVYDIRERCLIDGQYVIKADFSRTFQTIWPVIQAMAQSTAGQPTYFEATTALAFEIFKQHTVDYAIIETGLGGLYDSTNTIHRHDKLALITTLGLDHTEILGDTLALIAAQKAGILPFNGSAIVQLPDDPSAIAAIDDVASQRHTDITYINHTKYATFQNTDRKSSLGYKGNVSIDDIALSVPGEYFIKNAVLALQALEYLAARDGFTVQADRVRQAFAKLTIPGRFETKMLGEIPLILDGAHNPQKMTALLSSLQLTGQVPTVWLLALKGGKNATEIMSLIKPYAKAIYLTRFVTNQDGQPSNSAMPPAELVQAAKNAGHTNIFSDDSYTNAFDRARERATKQQLPLVVSGSFYLIGNLGNTYK